MMYTKHEVMLQEPIRVACEFHPNATASYIAADRNGYPHSLCDWCMRKLDALPDLPAPLVRHAGPSAPMNLQHSCVEKVDSFMKNRLARIVNGYNWASLRKGSR